jgi:hypothetical protein
MSVYFYKNLMLKKRDGGVSLWFYVKRIREKEFWVRLVKSILIKPN